MKEKIMALARKLGLFDKIKNKEMTSEDWQKFSAEFKKEHGVDILNAIKDAQKVPQLEKEHQEALTALFSETSEPPAAEPVAQAAAAEPAQPAAVTQAAAQPVNVAEEIRNLKSTVTAQQQVIDKLGAGPEPGNPTKVPADPKKTKPPVTGGVHTATHAFGIDHEFFSRSKPWNEITVTRRIKDDWSRGDATAFRDEFNKYSESLGNRVKQLHEMGVLGTKDMVSSINYDSFDNTGYGNEYVVRRQDALVAYIRSLPSVSAIFPVRYGVQNKMVMTNSFFTEFSQAYQAGKVYKGTFKLIPEVAKVDDVMFKHNFTLLKLLEKEYVGYLNREGSDPMKWTFIEWLMVQTLKVLFNEREQRRIRGYRIEPTEGTAGHHMFGSDGVVKRLRSYVAAFQVEPFTDLSMYTSSTLLTYVESFVEKVSQIVPSLRGYYLYMNEKHIPWYKALYRTAYGTDLDFKGPVLQVIDSAIDGIVGVPNMGNLCVMWITMPENVELYEDVPGEMEKIYFQRDLEELIAASWWREGSGAYLIGRKYASAVELAASARANQFIFLNDPYTELLADATTCDGSKNDRFKTIANSGSTTISNITSATEGIVYRIECGSATNASKTAKSGYFSNIDAWIPTAVGDFLEVYWNSTTSKFVEVDRQVTT
jgi:hypothetical protein